MINTFLQLKSVLRGAYMLYDASQSKEEDTPIEDIIWGTLIVLVVVCVVMAYAQWKNNKKDDEK